MAIFGFGIGKINPKDPPSSSTFSDIHNLLDTGGLNIANNIDWTSRQVEVNPAFAQHLKEDKSLFLRDPENKEAFAKLKSELRDILGPENPALEHVAKILQKALLSKEDLVTSLDHVSEAYGTLESQYPLLEKQLRQKFPGRDPSHFVAVVPELRPGEPEPDLLNPETVLKLMREAARGERNHKFLTSDEVQRELRKENGLTQTGHSQFDPKAMPLPAMQQSGTVDPQEQQRRSAPAIAGAMGPR